MKVRILRGADAGAVRDMATRQAEAAVEAGNVEFVDARPPRPVPVPPPPPTGSWLGPPGESSADAPPPPPPPPTGSWLGPPGESSADAPAPPPGPPPTQSWLGPPGEAPALESTEAAKVPAGSTASSNASERAAAFPPAPLPAGESEQPQPVGGFEDFGAGSTVTVHGREPITITPGESAEPPDAEQPGRKRGGRR